MQFSGIYKNIHSFELFFIPINSSKYYTPKIMYTQKVIELWNSLPRPVFNDVLAIIRLEIGKQNSIIFIYVDLS